MESVQVDKYSVFCHQSGSHLRLILGAGGVDLMLTLVLQSNNTLTITKMVYVFSIFLNMLLRLELC